jgi:3',5'-cyclic AMP phosphodiesterase CpdA
MGCAGKRPVFMKLLHISDFHVRPPDCTGPYDRDRPYRTHLVRDVRTLTDQLGSVDAILVGGNVAYCGAAEEYAAAITWVTELAEACGCLLERVFVIPGNHDIDRRAITSSAAVRNVHAAISRATNDRRRAIRSRD